MSVLTINGFTDREFSAEELTTVMVDIPNMYSLVTNLGIFGNPEPLAQTYVALEIDNMVVNLLPVTDRGAPASKGSEGRRKRKLFEVPMSAHEDLITVPDLMNLVAFGSKAPMMLEDAVGRRLLTQALKHQLTHEWRRIGALSGVVLDSDGTTLIDLFTEFGVTQKAVPFGGASSFNQYTREVKRHIEDNLHGETMTGVAALCSPEFYDAMLEDTDVKAAYNASAAMMRLNPNIDDARPAFGHQGVLWIEYRGSASAKNADGTATTRKFIPAGDARFFPLGTMTSASSYAAPGDFLEALNMPGQLYYAKSAPVDLNRGLMLHTQSAMLPIWKRPALLVRGHTGSSN
ncbi:MAG: major capsid protein [Hyphomicrobiaceae bacterium]